MTPDKQLQRTVPPNKRLISPDSPETWDAYHRIRRTVLFERRGLFGQYDPNRPDELRAGNYPKLLVVDSTYIGVVRIDVSGELARLRRVAIDESWQRKGYGRILIELAEAFARELGARRVESAVAPDAVEFYRKCGYQPLQPELPGPNDVPMYKHLRVAQPDERFMVTVAQSVGATDLGGRIIKVDHAGEHGAVNIYTGQILMARLTARHLVAELTEFRSHELRHREIFRLELQRRGRRRCRSYLLCGVGGLALGLITGLLGSSAIAATTVAVERVVLRHLEEQVARLRATDAGAVAAIAAIIAEEREHHDRSVVRARAGRFWPRVLTPLVSVSTEAVIWMGMRV